MIDVAERINDADGYLAARTGRYDYRRVRYLETIRMMELVGLKDTDTVFDVGAGWTEFSVALRQEGNSHCRYIPIDACIDGVDLQNWIPPREAEFFVALELLEHLEFPRLLVNRMKSRCSKAIIISTPNPDTTDVLGMDDTHKTAISWDMLDGWGFQVIQEVSFYGKDRDSLFGVWIA